MCSSLWTRLAAGLALLAAGQGRADVTLVAAGRPQAVIVVPADAPAVVRYAAEELRYHVEKASGAELPIVSDGQPPAEPAGRVCLGDCSATREAGIVSAQLPPEACVIRTRDGNLFVAGRDGQGEALNQNVWVGTLFGVYELLEEALGVRWLWPGELGEVIPRADRVAIDDTDRVVKPHFVQRWIRTSQQWHANRRAEQVWLRRHRMGRSRLLYPTHAFRNWWKQYGEEHPEYFNLLPNGRREPFGLPHEVSMCVSQPKLWRRIVENWLAMPDEKPGLRPLIDCSENDGIALCTCQACQAWDVPPVKTLKGDLTGPAGKVVKVQYRTPLSDRYARFWGAVQREAAKSDPDATVMTLAYSTYRDAPARAKLNDHVIVGIVAKLPFPEADGNVEHSRGPWRECGFSERG